jgi:hypothetical protein
MGFDRSVSFEKQVEEALDEIAIGYKSVLKEHMPAGGYRNFCLWGLSRQNPHRPDVLQIIAATQLSKLTARLLSDLTPDETSWKKLIRSTGLVNAWLILEVISDDLAIGLAVHQTGDDRRKTAPKRALLSSFNTLMTERLNGKISAASARRSLSDISSEEISLLNTHSAPDKLQSLIEVFSAEKIDAITENKFRVQDPLIANIEACVDVANAVEIEFLRVIVRDSVSARYERINMLLKPNHYSLEELIDSGTYTTRTVN